MKILIQMGFTIPMWWRNAPNRIWHKVWVNQQQTHFIPDGSHHGTILVIYEGEQLQPHDPNRIYNGASNDEPIL